LDGAAGLAVLLLRGSDTVELIICAVGVGRYGGKAAGGSPSSVDVYVYVRLYSIFISSLINSQQRGLLQLDAAGMKIHLAGIKTRSQRKNGPTNSYVDVCNFQWRQRE
jgi:hypothetical protein